VENAYGKSVEELVTLAFLLPIKISEAVFSEMDKVLIGTEAL
jgi:hypothetical protein